VVLKMFSCLVLVFFMLTACKNEVNELPDTSGYPDSEFKGRRGDQLYMKKSTSAHEVRFYKEVRYDLKVVSALDFLKRKKEKVEPTDLPFLKNEVVFMLELSSQKREEKDVLNLKQCELEYEKAIEYLAFHIQEDIYLKQGNRKLFPNSVHFEREFNISGKKRVLFFLTGLKLDSDFEVIWNDQVLEAGLLKFHFERNNN
jgi:hypothetical protein